MIAHLPLTHLPLAAAAPGARPVDNEGAMLFIIGGGSAAITALIAFGIVGWFSHRYEKRKNGKVYRLRELPLGIICFATLVTLLVAGIVAVGMAPREPSKLPGWTQSVDRWAASTYGVQSGSVAFGEGEPVACVASIAGDCYQATVLLPGRIQQVQLAYPNGIPVLVSVSDGQPLKALSTKQPAFVTLQLSSPHLGRDISRMYGLPGIVDAAGWGTHGDLPHLNGAGTAAQPSLFTDRVPDPDSCPGGANSCATGTILGTDGALHPASLVTLDQKTAILVDPATGVEFPRAAPKP
ncbi:hypothetical protein ACFVU2_19615 [Leifsonia sp. NPDC058194]|uniref:hypothetical protein n=1 Tax=Leifsonia sp. NPDC058194 TaxID=3346374 RepID=UPI0036DBC055